jgi:hypothetical protein
MFAQRRFGVLNGTMVLVVDQMDGTMRMLVAGAVD